MDTISKAKRIQAMNSYKAQHYLHNLIFHLAIVIALTCLLVCFYPYWFPSLYSPIKEFLLLSLPKTHSSVLSPKGLFIVVNIIVILLVGESKLVGSYSSSPASEIYDEYVQRSRSTRGISSTHLTEDKRVTTVQEEQVKEEVKEVITESSVDQEDEEFQEVQEEAEALEEDEAQDQDQANVKEKQAQPEAGGAIEEEKGSERDEENDGPDEELNRRVEEFIARVNRQRWLEEARLLVSCTA